MTQTTYPAPQPPAAEPKKKRGVLKWIPFGIVVALALIGIAVGPGDGDTPAPPPVLGSAAASDKPSPEESEAPTFQVGENATDDGYQFTVTNIWCGVPRVGDQYMGEKAQGQFCMVDLKVKNVSKEPINYSSENQALMDTKGREYSPDAEAWIYLDDSDTYGEINPGNTMKTTVPFDIPKKAKPDYLLLKAGVLGFSEGVRVKL